MSPEIALRNFLKERPAINRSAFAQECNIERMNFVKILSGLRKIPKAKRGLVLATMVKYGYQDANLFQANITSLLQSPHQDPENF